MKDFSVAAKMAFQMAAIETNLTRFEYLEAEHLLIGLCSLEKVLELKDRFHLNEEDQRAIQAERDAIELALDDCKLDSLHLRRNIRRKLGKSTYKNTGQVIHRSATCKLVFQRAEDFAASAQSVTCVHLFAALLDEPGERIRFTLLEAGVPPQTLQRQFGVPEAALQPENRQPEATPPPSQEPSPEPQDSYTPDIDALLEHLLKAEVLPRPSAKEPAPKKFVSPQPAYGTPVAPKKPERHQEGNSTQNLTQIDMFTGWESLRHDLMDSAQESSQVLAIQFSDRKPQKQNVIAALDAIANLKEGENQGYNVNRLSRILDVLNTRKSTIFHFLNLFELPQHKAVVFKALLDITDPAEHNYKDLIQRFLRLEGAIDDTETLAALLSRAPGGLQGTERVMNALHDINTVLLQEIESLLHTQKDSLDALLEAFEVDEMRAIARAIDENASFPLYVGLALYAIAAKTQGTITVGTFLRKYMCKEVPVLLMLGILNRNVFEGSYIRSPLVRPDVVDSPMDIAGSRNAIQEILQAFDETIRKSQAFIDPHRNIVIKDHIDDIPVSILIDPTGNITVDCHIIIRKAAATRHIILAPHEGRFRVKKGRVYDETEKVEVPGSPCNIAFGTEIFPPHTTSYETFHSVLHLISPKGVVYGSPEPTDNELSAAHKLIERQKAAEPKRTQLIEGERPKPLTYKHLVILYVMKHALEQFYTRYMKEPHIYLKQLAGEPEASRKFQRDIDQHIQQLLELSFRIFGQLSQDKSGGWKKFWELFATTIPQQLCKYIEMTTEFRNKAQFIMPVLGIQLELGEVYWNIARLIVIKGGNRIPPIPKATAPSGVYKEILDNIQEKIQTEPDETGL